MTEEEIKALQEALVAEQAARKSAEDQSLQWKLAAEKNKADVDKIVLELQDERKKKQEALDKANLSNTNPDVEQTIARLLQERDEQQKKQDFESAVAEFKSSKPEFQADAAGIVFGKFQQGLQRFNFSDVTSKDQLKQRLEEAYKFLNFTPGGEEGSSYEGSPSLPNIPGEQRHQQSADVKTALELTGMEESRYKELKAKYGEAMENMGL